MMKRIISIVLCLGLILSAICVSADSLEDISRIDYNWNNVQLGGGGYVTGVVCHPLEKDLVYIRTDVGGAYRWDKDEKKWICLTDWVPMSQSNFMGIDGIAVDPNNPDIVYMECGKYPWSGGAVLKSVDRGTTWTKIATATFWANGNSYRRWGEPIAVDPANSNIIYFAGYKSTGVSKSIDGGTTWSKNIDINTMTDTTPLRDFEFDKTTSDANGTRVIYASVYGVGVYISQDYGESWKFMEGSPVKAQTMAISDNGKLVVGTGNSGAVSYFNGEWKTVFTNTKNGYVRNVAIDSKDSNYIIVAGDSKSLMLVPIWVTQDGGETWVETAESSKDINFMAKWYEDDNFSSNTAGLAIDPFDKSHIIMGDFFSVWETDDILKKPMASWYQSVNGIEEIVPFIVHGTPEGAKYRLLVSCADNDGFLINDVTKFPTRKFTNKYSDHGGMRIMGCTDVEFCENKPDIVARIGVTHSQTGAGNYSLDGGDTWNKFETYPTDANGKWLLNGKMAMSSDVNKDTGKATIISIPVGHCPMVSYDYGTTWTDLTQFPNLVGGYWTQFTVIASDKVIPDKFYIYANNKINITEDGGKTWYDGADIKFSGNIKTVFGMQNEVWAGDLKGGLYRSSDGAKSFTKIAGVSELVDFAFGKAAPGKTSPTLYVYATIDNTVGVYRSSNFGKTWERIDMDYNKLGNNPTWLAADRRDYGVVYVTFDGRGVMYGAPMDVDMSATSDVNAEASEEVKVTVNGNPVDLEKDVIVKDKTVYVPARTLLRKMSYNINWYEKSDLLVASREEFPVNKAGLIAVGNKKIKTATLKNGSTTINIDGVDKIVKSSMFVENNISYIPLTEVVEALGSKIKFDPKTNTYNIYDTVLVVD